METVYIYVQDKDGKPLMPTTRRGWVRRALKRGRATVVQSVPFTIRLAYETKKAVVQKVALGTDPGRTNVGIAAAREDGKCLFRAHTTTRNKEIPRLMADRRCHRQASRRGERQARKRIAKRLGTTLKGFLKRKLPGYGDGFVTVKDIINTEARFNNRKRPPGWLTPTARQLLQTHQNFLILIERILPIRSTCFEMNVFDFVKMDNPKVYKYKYGNGPLKGYGGSVKAALFAAQGGKCLLCGKNACEDAHHLHPGSKNGSDTLGNMAGLCKPCHKLVHTKPEASAELSAKKEGFNKKYGALSVLNQIIPYYAEWAADRYPNETYTIEGYGTKKLREAYALEKDHDVDAYCIAMSAFPGAKPDKDMPKCYEIRQFRRNDRANIKAQVARSYYLDGKKVAQNRKPAYEAVITEGGKVKAAKQKMPALSDWFEKMVKEHGKLEAEHMRSRLVVKKSYRRYNDRNRILPGAVFYYEGKRHVMSGQITNGKYLRAVGDAKTNYPADKCRIARNKGLVFL